MSIKKMNWEWEAEKGEKDLQRWKEAWKCLRSWEQAESKISQEPAGS